MARDVEAVKLAIASLFTNQPITPSQAMADLDISTKPSETCLFEPGPPVVRLPPHTSYSTAPPAQTSRYQSPTPAGEAPQTRDESELWEHPVRHSFTVPETGLRTKKCHVVGKKDPQKAHIVAQKEVVEIEAMVKQKEVASAEQIQTRHDALEEDVKSDSKNLEDDYDSDSALDSEEAESDEEAFSKYDVLRRTDDEDTLLGEDGNYSIYPDSSDDSDED